MPVQNDNILLIIKPFMKKLLCLLTFMVFLLPAKAIDPVTVTVNLPPPYTPFLNEYASADLGKLQVILTVNDSRMQNYPVKIQMVMERMHEGIVMQTSTYAATPIILLNGQTTEFLSGLDLSTYFIPQNLVFSGIDRSQYIQTGRIPDGMYRMGFRVVDSRRTDVVLSNTAFSAPGWFLLNEPPLLNAPRNNMVERIMEPQNVKLEWFPRHLGSMNSAFAVQYQIEVFPMRIPNMDPNHVVMGTQPLFYDIVNTNFYYLSYYSLLLEPGVQYAWRVRAISDNELTLFQNNGYSEVFTFTYGSPCPVPENSSVTLWGAEAVDIDWDSDFRHSKYELRFRVKDQPNAVWNSKETFTNNTRVEALLTAGMSYEYQVKAVCNQVASDYSAIQDFKLPDEPLKEFVCGDSDDDPTITNRNPKASLQPNDIIHSGQFPIKLIEVSGTNGTFSGVARMKIPFLKNIQVVVEFNDVKVNELNQVYAGEFKSIYNPDSKFLISLPIKEEMETNKSYGNQTPINNSENTLDSLSAPEEDNTAITDNEKTVITKPDGIEEVVDNQNQQDTTLLVDNKNELDNENDSVGEDNNNNDNVPLNNNTNSSGSSEPNVKIWCAQDNKDYDHGDIIDIPFNSIDNHMAFKLKNYPEGTQNFQWILTRNGIDLTVIVKNNEPNLNNFGCNLGGLFGDIKLKAIYDDKEIEVSINVLKDEFGLKEMYAKHKEKRVAKSSEILYLVDGNATTSSEQVRYDITLSPDLTETKYESSDITWSYEDQSINRNLNSEFGKTFINRNLKEVDAIITTSVHVGYPNKATKSIDVKWIDGSKKELSFIPVNSIRKIKSTYETIERNLKAVEGALKVKGVKIELEPISIEGSTQNKEDNNSRLYFTEETGAVSGGLTASFPKMTLTHPVLNTLSRIGVADVGFYMQFSIGAYLKGGIERYKYVESIKHQGSDPFVEFESKGCLTAGLEAKLLVARNLVDFNVNGYVQGCIAGNLKYQFASETFDGKIYIPPLILGGNVMIKTRGTLEFELIDWTGSITISEEITLID